MCGACSALVKPDNVYSICLSALWQHGGSAWSQCPPCMRVSSPAAKRLYPLRGVEDWRNACGVPEELLREGHKRGAAWCYPNTSRRQNRVVIPDATRGG